MILPVKANAMLLQMLPEGLKPHEVKYGNSCFHPPIPYIPKKPEEVDPDHKVSTIKIKLTTGVVSGISVYLGRNWDRGTILLSHNCYPTRRRKAYMGLFTRHEEADE